MKWNIVLLIMSLGMLVLWVGVGFIEHLTQAESIADRLAPQIGVDSRSLIPLLEGLLEESQLRRTIVYGVPWLLMTVLLTVRLVDDHRRTRKDRLLFQK